MVDENQVSNGEPAKKDQPELHDLLESSHPLLKEFRDKCPGTFKHSQQVAGMVEALSTALGLDVTFMRVAAIYHDIGKIVNPKYFSENQLEDENPHEKLDPRMSYQIISRHVADTALILLNEPMFPRDLIQIISQHHGTSIIKYFYAKYIASKRDGVEDYFRYRCLKPETVESMILMICDRIEAKSRADIQARKLDISNVITEIWDELESDRQFEDVVMKLGHVVTIKETLAKELEGMYQKRIDYSKAKDEGKSSHISKEE